MVAMQLQHDEGIVDVYDTLHHAADLQVQILMNFLHSRAQWESEGYDNYLL